jgi:hypothetical protein
LFKKNSNELGIGIFAYNRPSHLRRVLISLENYKIKTAHIFLDGPKNSKDKIIQKEILFMTKYNPYIKLKLVKNNYNRGLADSITSGIEYLSKRYKNIIILEDDCIPRSEFFNFIYKSIHTQEFKKNLNPICGYQLPEIQKNEKKYLYPIFLDFFIPWGWCISARYWKMYQKYLKLKNKKKIDNVLLNKIRIITKNKNKSIWSKDFIEYNILKSIKIIFPSISLIKNIGFDGSGVNSGITDVFNSAYLKSKFKSSVFKIKSDKFLQRKQMKILIKRVKYFF